MKHSTKGSNSKTGGNKAGQVQVKRDRKSATGLIGSPKKGGHGGKFTWSGGDGYSEAELGYYAKVTVVETDPKFVDLEE